MTQIWFAACIEENCARYGKKMTGSPVTLEKCPKCLGPLEWEQQDILSGPAVTADPNEEKKRPHEDGDLGDDASIKPDKKVKGADGQAQPQDLKNSTPVGGMAPSRAPSVVETPPFHGFECELVQQPEKPLLSDAVYCLMHHSVNHQTGGCNYTKSPPPAPAAFVRLHWEDFMTAADLGTFRKDQMPVTMLDAMVHVSMLNKVCIDAKTFIEKRDALLLQARNCVKQHLSDAALVEWDGLNNQYCVQTQYMLDVIMWTVARLQQDVIEAPLEHEMAYRKIPVAANGSYTHELIARFAAGLHELPNPKLVRYNSILADLVNVVEDHDSSLCYLAVALTRVLNRHHKELRAGEVFKSCFLIARELIIHTPDTPLGDPDHGLHLCTLPDPKRRQKKLFAAFQQYIDANRPAA